LGLDSAHKVAVPYALIIGNQKLISPSWWLNSASLCSLPNKIGGSTEGYILNVGGY